MFVVKRDGRKEPVSFDKILARVSQFTSDLDSRVDPVAITQEVIRGLYNGVTTVELDTLSSEIAAAKTTHHPDFAVLAGRLAVSNLHKETQPTFSAAMQVLDADELLRPDFMGAVNAHADVWDRAIVTEADYGYTYFGFKTLEKSYLLRDRKGRIQERPQYMLMRVAVALFKHDTARVLETYKDLSKRYFTHATPTLYNAGTTNQQLSSCFLQTMQSDSLEGIYDTLKQCAQISKRAGGIGLSISDIRATGSRIKGTNGKSMGLVPMLRVFNETARYIDQGGKRNGSFAMYLEPWHADVEAFLDLKKNGGKEEHRARDLFYALWIPDLFMERVKAKEMWSLFCPSDCPGLTTSWGAEFNALYTSYERAGKARRTLPARDLWAAIVKAQIETGTPYMLYKDACNRKSNQQHLGCIKNSNLCAEIVEYCAPDEVAVCNLASMCLPAFVCARSDGQDGKVFDFDAFGAVVERVIRCLNRVITINTYPLLEAEKSNLRHRPVGLGVQGLADVFIMLRMPFDSDEARALNRLIFETMYFHALTASNQLATEEGVYSSYPGSPASMGRLQPDLWGVETTLPGWPALRERIAATGLRNSLLIAPMPTASTAQINGWNEAFEPYTSNLYTRRVMAGEFQVVNTQLVRDLIHAGVWSEQVRQEIIRQRGSIQAIPGIPESLKALYKTAWEIKQRVIIDLAADRGPFIDQTQSMNVFLSDPTYGAVTSLHFNAWEKGLKTGMYYLRSRPAADAIQITVAAPTPREVEQQIVCSITNREACESCSG